MRKDLMTILVCPVCKSRLELEIDQDEEDDVISGTLLCTGCDGTYPIADSIPNLLPPLLRA